MCLLVSFLCLTRFVQRFKQIQGNSSLGMRSCLSLFTWFQGTGRTERLGFPEIMAPTHLVYTATLGKKRKVFLDLSRNIRAILAYFCSPACWQYPQVTLLWVRHCRHPVRHFRSRQELVLHLGQALVLSRAWRELESWELVEGFHSTHVGTGKLIIVAHAREQPKTQC